MSVNSLGSVMLDISDPRAADSATAALQKLLKDGVQDVREAARRSLN